ncbi:putative transcriptional regulator [Neoasaia chiangmaiensis NBRC 101099]|uniref:HTH arsR-type domain-containing protein n=2 Tax=Neoasaia chiangmaiensis TaxID=320497 RepID=A0A1U9KMZ6_9PROT|nr:metalloregulator ArsR/SmtB family transcription factor [Neoasaia chiangmaiensis]AQS87166.1 hypothetical protein A0U93_03570 [Neoasaia chiangmaiensis]GBR38211.1 putative transcriptional regulator [Neoasaia chiangmaiensis NBRC 101099]
MMDKRKNELAPDGVLAITKALADARRVGILTSIARAGGEMPCCQLPDLGKVSAATISHHMKELENAGLIAIRREGKFAHLRLCDDVVDAYCDRMKEMLSPPP